MTGQGKRYERAHFDDDVSIAHEEGDDTRLDGSHLIKVELSYTFGADRGKEGS